MSKHSPQTIQELIDYTKRKLGEDVADDSTIEVDITDDQCEDLVADAVQMWKTYALDGTVECFFVIPTITGQTEYDLPSNTVAVYGYIPYNEYTDMFSLDYQMKTHIGMHYRTYDLTTIQLTKEHLTLMDQKLGKKFTYTFNAATKKLYITAGAQTGSSIVVLASKWVDEVPNIYNEIWLKKYVEALFLKQWGTNFRQFDGEKLPGGITINWKDMISDAKEKIEKLEAEVITHWSRPIRMKRG